MGLSISNAESGAKKKKESLQNSQVWKFTSSNLPNVGHIFGLVTVSSAWHLDIWSSIWSICNTEALIVATACSVTHRWILNNTITLFNLLVSHISPDSFLICTRSRELCFFSAARCRPLTVQAYINMEKMQEETFP